MMDMAHLEHILWAMIAVDEAHRVKTKTVSCIGLWLGILLRIGCQSLELLCRIQWRSYGLCCTFLNPDQFDYPVAFEESFSFPGMGDKERGRAAYHIAPLKHTKTR
jgi:hypothetical protein